MSNLLTSFQSVLEHGEVWAAELGTNTFNLYKAITDEIDVYVKKIEFVAQDADPATTKDFIPEFQKFLSLPRCDNNLTEEEARQEILATLLQNKPFKQELISDLAEVYDIGSVLLTRKGAWHLGVRLLDYESVSYPRCGVARCGRDRLSVLQTPFATRSARCGVARCGRDRLYEFLLNKAFFCQLEELRPAETELDFDLVVNN